MKHSKKNLLYAVAITMVISSCTPTQNLKEMTIYQLPDQTEYIIGERLDLSGLLIMDNSSDQLIISYTSTPSAGYVFTESDIGTKKITISKENYKSVSFTVEVLNRYFFHYLRVEKLPNKTEYVVGECFDSEGLVVYDSKTMTVTTDYEINVPDGTVFGNEHLGTNYIYVSKPNYNSDSFTVEVITQLQDKKNKAQQALNDYYDNLELDFYSEENKQKLIEIRDEYLAKINNARDESSVDYLLTTAIELLDEVEKQTEVLGIVVKEKPLRTTFQVGDEFSYNGLTVCLDYGGGAVKEIQGYQVHTPNMNVVQDAVEVKITYEDYETSFPINIKSKTLTGVKKFSVFATNDIHGQIEEQGSRASSGKVMTYLKNQREKDNVVIVDQGDTWQGSIYSNYNHGALLTDLMNYVRYDSRTVGNHDFDWGAEYIELNNQREYNGYKATTLAANVYDYDFQNKIVGNIQQSQIGLTSTSFTLENGLKVGIVGTIGKDQITSISTIYAQDYAFVDHIETIKQEATRLRNDEGCNVIISSNHCDEDELLGHGLAGYVDLVLCAHSHQRENSTEDGLYYAQYGAYNTNVGNIEMEYNPATGKVSYTKKSYTAGYTINEQITELDPTINSILTKYNDEVEESASEIVANNVTGSFYSSDTLPNVMCNAILDRAYDEGYEVDLAYCNNARASLYSHVWTYADLYQAFPFDNTIYIIEVSYYEMVNEIGRYNFVCRSSSFNGILDPNKTYKVACLDYLAFHTNSNRDYDYFKDNNGRYIGKLSDNYRIILKEWLIESGYSKGALLDSDNFSSSISTFSREFVY